MRRALILGRIDSTVYQIRQAVRRLTTSKATRGAARARLREVLGPVREEAENYHADEGGADVVDAIRIYEARPHLVPPEKENLFALAETAGWSLFTPLYYVFLEDEP